MDTGLLVVIAALVVFLVDFISSGRAGNSSPAVVVMANPPVNDNSIGCAPAFLGLLIILVLLGTLLQHA